MSLVWVFVFLGFWFSVLSFPTLGQWETAKRSRSDLIVRWLFDKKKSGFLGSELIHGQLICALLRSIGISTKRYGSWILWSKGFDLEARLLQIYGSQSSWLTLWRRMANPLSLDLEAEMGYWESLSKIIWLFFCWLFVFGRKRIKRKPTGNTRWSQNTRLVSPFGQLKTRFPGFSIFS